MSRMLSFTALALVYVLWCEVAFAHAGVFARGHTPPSSLAASSSIAVGDGIVMEEGTAPKIFFPETSYDFGTIPQDGSVSHSFVVRNTGKAQLKIIEAKGT